MPEALADRVETFVEALRGLVLAAAEDPQPPNASGVMLGWLQAAERLSACLAAQRESGSLESVRATNAALLEVRVGSAAADIIYSRRPGSPARPAFEVARGAWSRVVSAWLAANASTNHV